jgi:predicted HTH domain antitoxin
LPDYKIKLYGHFTVRTIDKQDINMQLTLNIPDHCLPQQDKKSLGEQLKLYSALLLFQSGQLSRGAACEFAGVDIYNFLAACKQYKIPVINTEPSDIEADLLRFQRRHSS